MSVRAAEWIVAELMAWPDCTTLRLTPTHHVATRARTFVYPADHPLPIRETPRVDVVRPRRWLHALRRAGAQLTPFGGLMSAARHEIELLPHQIEPALAVLRHGATRVLIADGVGLGKTIQAGLVLAELTARRTEFRALVLVPAGLRDQWCAELSNRFQIGATFADAEWLRSVARERPPDVNPWSIPGVYVASLDFVKRPEVLRPLEDLTWHLVVVDEAHAATAGSDRRAAAHAVAQRAERVLLLTATPYAGAPGAFAALCALGTTAPSEPPIVLFRRSLSSVGSAPERRRVVFPVRLAPAELRMHGELDRYTRRIWLESAVRDDSRARLASIILRKRALSSAASLASSVRRRLELLAGVRPVAGQLRLPLADEDPLEDDGFDAALGAAGLADARLERDWLEAIADHARRAAEHESKLRRLLRFLARVREPAIVFTEYRDTLAQIAAAAGHHRSSVLVMHGGLSPAERARVQRDFNQGGALLLATDAASEGLNLHSRCRLVIHFELPWSAARLAQRTGRVDRYGQTRRVHEVAFVAASTAERLVIEPLARRAAGARAAGTDHAHIADALTESRIAELVMSPSQATSPALTRGAGTSPETASVQLDGDAREEVRRATTARAWLQGSGERAQPPGVVFAAMVRARTPRLPAGLVFVYTLTVADAQGQTIHLAPLVLHASVTPPMTRSAKLLRSWLASALVAEPDIDRYLRAADARALQHVMRLLTAARESVRRRLESQQGLLPLAARELVQASLFDRRAIRAAASRRQVRSERKDALHDAVAALSEPPDLRCRSTLTAVLVVTRRAART